MLYGTYFKCITHIVLCILYACVFASLLCSKQIARFRDTFHICERAPWLHLIIIIIILPRAQSIYEMFLYSCTARRINAYKRMDAVFDWVN